MRVGCQGTRRRQVRKARSLRHWNTVISLGRTTSPRESGTWAGILNCSPEPEALKQAAIDVKDQGHGLSEDKSLEAHGVKELATVVWKHKGSGLESGTKNRLAGIGNKDEVRKQDLKAGIPVQ